MIWPIKHHLQLASPRCRIYLLLWLSDTLDPIPALYGIGFQVHRSGSSMEFKKQATRVTKRCTQLIPSPKRSSGSPTILTHWRVSSCGMRSTIRSRRISQLSRLQLVLSSFLLTAVVLKVGPIGIAGPCSSIGMIPILL